MNKSAARNFFSQKRYSITSHQKMKWDDLILIQFQKLNLPHLETIFVYAAMADEVDTDALVDYLHFQNQGMRTAYPVSDFSTNTMQAMLVLEETEFVINSYGIAEPESSEVVQPESIDLIIVPLLCFDKEGYRVGYGKGFYDKYLTQTKPDAIKIGLCYYEPLDKINDRDVFDVPLNYCITPERLYEF